ncbi:MAG: hypothetical protein EOO56_11295, partial [Hymenobacter sp.]
MFQETLRLKLRYILWPYTRVLLALVAGAALFHVALFKALPQYEPPDWLWTFVGPLVGGLLVVLLALWPNFRLIKEKQAGKGSLGQLLAIVALAIFALTWSSGGHYLRAMLSPLQPLPTLAELSRYAPTRYYQVQWLRLDTLHAGNGFRSEITGRNSEHLYFNLFIACPAAPSADSTAAVPAWVGFCYTHEMSSRASPAEKRMALHAFLVTSSHQFNLDNARPCAYLARSPNDNERAGLREAATHSTRYRAAAEPPLILLPVYEPFAQRGRTAGRTFWWSLGIGNGLFLLLLLALPLDEVRRQALLAG